MSMNGPRPIVSLQNLQSMTFSRHSIDCGLRTDDQIDAVLVPNENPAHALPVHTKFIITLQTSFLAKIDDFSDLCIS
jgi:hypothetical protein